MKPSGVEWLGDIPKRWPLERLQWHLEEISVKNDPIQTTNILSLTNNKGVIPYSEKGNVGNKAKDDYTQYKLAYRDTLVVNSMNVLIGSVGLSKYDGCVSPVYYVFKAREDNEIRFFSYLFQIPPFQKDLRRFANGILEIRLRISSSDILRRMIAIPPILEQKAIADYLDAKCETIDAAIAEAKKGIEEYKAWRVAVITEATTVGIQCGYSLVKSELSWIPHHPLRWEKCQLSSLCDRDVSYGIVKLGEPVSFGVKVLRCSDIKGGFIDLSGIRTVSKDISDEYKRTILKGGEVVVNVRGTLGGCAVVPYSLGGANIAREVAMLDIIEAKACRRFIMYALLSSNFANYVGYEMSGAIYQGLNIATLCKYSFYAPDIYEQSVIADYLDEKCAAIDKMVAEKEALIADLEAYKKSLIYEVVTGKGPRAAALGTEPAALGTEPAALGTEPAASGTEQGVA